MSLHDAIFLALAGITLLGGVLAVVPRNVFHNAMALILSLFGVAGLFIYLQSEFLAVVEVIIYIGAISVAIIFAIMLSKPWDQAQRARSPFKMAKAALAAVLLFAGLARLILKAPWAAGSPEGDYSVQKIGRALVGEYALPFEVVSLILLIAIIGALVVSNSKESA